MPIIQTGCPCPCGNGFGGICGPCCTHNASSPPFVVYCKITVVSPACGIDQVVIPMQAVLSTDPNCYGQVDHWEEIPNWSYGCQCGGEHCPYPFPAVGGGGFDVTPLIGEVCAGNGPPHVFTGCCNFYVMFARMQCYLDNGNLPRAALSLGMINLIDDGITVETSSCHYVLGVCGQDTRPSEGNPFDCHNFDAQFGNESPFVLACDCTCSLPIITSCPCGMLCDVPLLLRAEVRQNPF